MQSLLTHEIKSIISDKDSPKIPAEVVSHLAIVALAMWPDNFRQQCEEMARQLNAYRKIQPLSDQLDTQKKPVSYQLH